VIVVEHPERITDVDAIAPVTAHGNHVDLSNETGIL
jgi:hypothetical protein